MLLFCWRCYHPIGDQGDLAKVLLSAPIKILLHHRLFPLNEDLVEGDNLKNKGDNFFEDLFHVTPPLFSGSGESRKAIKRDEEPQAEEIYTCLYGKNYLPRVEGFMNDRNHQQLASFDDFGTAGIFASPRVTRPMSCALGLNLYRLQMIIHIRHTLEQDVDKTWCVK